MKRTKNLVQGVYGYCRVSTIDQVEEGDSLDAQEQKIIDYCKLKNLPLISVHKEQGISGAIEPRKRPQLALILAKLDADEGTGIVSCKIDRLSRSTKDFLNLMDEFKQKKYKFYCITPDIDAETTIGNFTMNLLSLLSQLERSTISDRVKEVFSHKRKKQELLGQVPFGKRLKENTNILENDEDEQETIRIVQELRKETKLAKKEGSKYSKTRPFTYQEICNELIKQKRLNKDKKVSWFPSQIRRILFNGEYKSGK